MSEKNPSPAVQTSATKAPTTATAATKAPTTVKAAAKPLFALLIILVLLSVPLVLGFFGRLHPALDSFAHFRAHIAVIMSAGGIVLLLTRLRREAAMVTLLGLSALSTTIQWGSDANFFRQDGVAYKLMQINLQQDNPEPKALLQAIARNQPDIITYQEGSQQWQSWLKILEANYPYHHQCGALPQRWGVGILSRRPFAEFGAPVCTGTGVLATALVNFGGTNVLISSLHQSWPWPYPQARQFDLMQPALEAMDNPHNIPVIIAGDFNAVGWSYGVRKIEAASNTRHIGTIGATWLTPRLPDGLKHWIGLPIDQILVNETVSVHTVRTDQASGSDHLPVLLEFSVPAPQSMQEPAPAEEIPVEQDPASNSQPVQI